MEDIKFKEFCERINFEIHKKGDKYIGYTKQLFFTFCKVNNENKNDSIENKDRLIIHLMDKQCPTWRKLKR